MPPHYNPATRLFEYHHCLRLAAAQSGRPPHLARVGDVSGTGRFVLGNRDWLLGMTVNAEERALHRGDDSERPSPVLPERLRRLLWLLVHQRRGAGRGGHRPARRRFGQITLSGGNARIKKPWTNSVRMRIGQTPRNTSTCSGRCASVFGGR